MTLDPNNYLALPDNLLYGVIGNLMLMGIIGQIILLVYCANKQMPYQAIILLSLLWWSTLVGMYYDAMIWTFVVLIAGGISYYVYSKRVRRG